MDKVKEIGGYNTIIKARIYNCIHANEYKMFNDFFNYFIEFYNVSYNPTCLENTTKKKQTPHKKKCPSIPAKNYDVGHLLVSDNDTLEYMVILQKNGIKRWVKSKS